MKCDLLLHLKTLVFSSAFLLKRQQLFSPVWRITRLVGDNLYFWVTQLPACQIAGWFLRRRSVGSLRVRGEFRAVTDEPALRLSSHQHLLLEVRAWIHTSVSGAKTKGSLVWCLFLFFPPGFDEKAAVLKCFRQRREETKERRKKKLFYTIYSNDFFSPPLKGWLRVAHQSWQRHGLTAHVIETIDCNFINTNMHKARRR